NPQFFGGRWSRQVNNSIKTPQDLINSQVSELTNATPEQRTKIWQREKAIYDSMLADYKAGNKEIQKDLIYQGQLVAAIGKQYFEALKSQTQVAEGAKVLTKEQIKFLSQLAKVQSDFENDIRKLREKNHLNTLEGYDKEVQAIKYRYEEEVNRARRTFEEINKQAGELGMPGLPQMVIDSHLVQLSFQKTAEILKAIQDSGTLTPSLQMARGYGRTEYQRQQATAAQLNRGPSSLPSVNVQRHTKDPKIDLSILTEGLKRASR